MAVQRMQFEAIGTQWEIQVANIASASKWSELQAHVQRRIAEFDANYSRFRKDSLVTEMSRHAGKYSLPADGYRLLQFYEKLYRATEGLVTPLIGQGLSDAGYDANYSFQRRKIQRPQAWDEIITYDRKSITLKKPALLDFGAAGKGYLVDIIADIIHVEGAESYLINAGGDILQRSEEGKELEVGLESPFDSSLAIGTVHIRNKSLCASAGNKRKWGRYTHIINPMSLQSPTEIVATWVVADDTLTADGLATALFFISPERLQRDFSFSYAVLDQQSQLHYDKDLPITIFGTDET